MNCHLSARNKGLALALLLASCALMGTAHAQRSPRTLFTSYEHSAGSPNINWLTCGSTPDSNGCYGSGQIGPFGHACAVTKSGDKVIVVDTFASDPGQDPKVALRIYKEVVSSTPSVTLQKTIDLPVSASMTATCSAATLGNLVFVGTSDNPNFHQANLRSGAVASGQICGTPTQGISSDGVFVVVDQGVCRVWLDKDGGKFSGGAIGSTFFPSSGASIPLR